MLFYYMSLAGVIVLTLNCIASIYRKREKLTCMAGMMIAMTIGMMSSIAFGTILAILLYDLVSSTIIAVLLGMLTGYWAGKAISLMASMDGMLAGIMGGMMGAMLGVMVNRPLTITAFVDTVFLFVILVLRQLMMEEAGMKKINGRLGNGSFVAIVLGVAIVSFLIYFG